jgi:hypothetical protein
VASRHAHRVVDRAGGTEAAARVVRMAVVLVFAVMLAGLSLRWASVAIAAFVALALVHNVFRPVLVGRFDEHVPAALGATVLSVESQATSLGAAILAPLLGLAIDLASRGADGVRLWPVAAVGLGLTVVLAVIVRPPPEP